VGRRRPRPGRRRLPEHHPCPPDGRAGVAHTRRGAARSSPLTHSPVWSCRPARDPAGTPAPVGPRGPCERSPGVRPSGFPTLRGDMMVCSAWHRRCRRGCRSGEYNRRPGPPAWSRWRRGTNRDTRRRSAAWLKRHPADSSVAGPATIGTECSEPIVTTAERPTEASVMPCSPTRSASRRSASCSPCLRTADPRHIVGSIPTTEPPNVVLVAGSVGIPDLADEIDVSGEPEMEVHSS
jgi:hypothetical protein